ncbi:MAG: hypothetical protein AB1656_15540 [Candidatus Omnitrophota bacterium]
MSDFSASEKNKLLKNFRQSLAESKAAEMGVSPDELIARYANGKIGWIKRQEAYEQLERQRELSGPKKIVRSLRDGEDSLIGKIFVEINQTIELVNRLAKDNILNSLERVDHLASTSKIQQRSTTLKDELTNVESQIDRTKSGDPLFEQAENVLKVMREAQEKGDNEKLAQLRGIHGETLRKYEIRRKSLEPYLESARHGRADMQRELWRIYQLRWKLQHTHIASLQKTMTRLAAQESAKSAEKSIAQDYAGFLKQYHGLGEKQNLLSQKTPASQDDLAKSMKLWDKILPIMKDYLDHQQFFQEVFQEITEKIQVIDNGDSSKRMAFAKKKER